ncbi:cbb3-type cytochrome oxidase subunit 3 [Bordetella genomosp. 13]|uniref:CcoQ/FixQ family Cbb3-type cytochrome c oxidase assembly chaperone n=1 Tax=Bordetella genomosp. 13 TaxID=463040 RepID=A0A1W6ZDQ6_9BORD|nr:CcoQ/FixQ family Cbb3-type cytochrome c oxidase assembly chaperone [Bordetella genomosp. 13]ARP94984.1 CcoQ/FixQ family Cbb3-type cytochrome c oxidase assembly chaperone [Bordetella genomosp. 13]
MGYLSAFVTALSMATFFGILWWACSRGRQDANRDSAMLPFALPDEGGPMQQDGATRP